jgi:two-component system, chemotaxis family, chemotaxis protein CheY
MNRGKPFLPPRALILIEDFRKPEATVPLMQPLDDKIALLLGSRKVLLIDDEHYTRKVIRTLLMTIGLRNVQEATDGRAGLEAIRTAAPDIVLVDWEMPGLDGPGFVRAVRSPATFPHPDVPIIMLTAHGERSRVIEAARLGINEYLLKPVSSQALQARILSVVTHPRPMVRRGDYYGPEPRKMSTYKPENDPGHSNLVMVG